MPNHPKTVSIDGWKGINNILSPERTPQDYLKEALNVDIDNSGGIHKRKGYTKVISGNFKSIWSDGNTCFAIKDGDLIKLNTDYTYLTLYAGLQDGLTFVGANDVFYGVSASFNCVIENDTVRPFGISQPNPKPRVTEIGGGQLLAGIYQVAVVYVSADGRESGCNISTLVQIHSNTGAILIDNISPSNDFTVDRIRVYVSSQNGEVLYLHTERPDTVTSITIYDDSINVTPMHSLGIMQPPHGHIIREFSGRLWIAEDNILFYSEPYSYEWFNYHTNFMVFNERIRAIMPVENGIWVAADKLYYLRGASPDEMELIEREPVLAVEGSDVKIEGANIAIDNTPVGYKWLITTDKGIFVCFNDGIAFNLTSKDVNLPLADEGTASFVQKDGINRYVSILKEKSPPPNAAVGDMVTATIIRNGVVTKE